VPEAVAGVVVSSGPIATAVASGGPLGDELHALARRLFPIPRSLTGDGVRETLAVLGETLPLDVTEVPSGTKAYDWAVPPEWNVRGAWIENAAGERLVDLTESTLHVVGYSEPVRRRIRGVELLEHVHWLPDHPEWVPARTSYYQRNWGFCVTGAQRASISPDEEYDVVIDSTLDDGSLTYAELVVPGQSEREVLLSTYVCHPSLANDNLSGIVVLAALGRLLPAGLRHTYRIVFAPSTIGALVWLSRNERRLPLLEHGLTVSCVGDAGPLTYKQSRRADAPVDRAAAHVVLRRPAGSVRAFVPWGGDERQFCSPGFDLPVGSLTRTPHGQYPEYHTSADDLELLRPGALQDSLEALAEILDVLERDIVLESLHPHGEPQLGRRGLYETIGAGLPVQVEESRQALLWVLNQADSHSTLLDVAERAGLPFESVCTAADRLAEAGLVRKADSG
jgi:aminopeptidase-like protein